MQSIILTTPILLVLYGIALLFGIIGLKNKKRRVLASVSIIICVLTTGYALLKGASLPEIAVVLLIFLAVNLVIFTPNGGEK